MAEYAYTSLQDPKGQIRLLTLFPGAFSDQIVLGLQIHSLALRDKNSYEALSYVWGSSKETKPVFLEPPEEHDGNLPSSLTEDLAGEKATQLVRFEATVNLESALRYLRRVDQPRTLWIDALCINQRDDIEKGFQVAIMTDIYRDAKVVLWLGTEENDSEHAMKLMASMGAQIQVDWRTCLPRDQKDVNLSWTDESSSDPHCERDFTAIHHLLTRPYFNRLWIRQEVFLCGPDSILLCGPNEMLWDRYGAATIVMRMKFKHALENGEWSPEQLQDPCWQSIAICNTESYESIDLALEDAMTAYCYDPRDRIYANLYASEVLRSSLTPDYTKSVQEVYTDATRRIIALNEDLRILSHCDSQMYQPGLPSWVCNWHHGSLIHRHRIGQCPNWAAGGTRAEIQYRHDGQRWRLGIAGIAIQTVEHVWPTVLDDRHSSLSFQNLPSLEFLISQRAEKGCSRDVNEALDILCRAVFCNKFGERFEPPLLHFASYSETRDSFRRFWSKRLDQSMVFDETSVPTLGTIPMLSTRYLYMTSSGELGLCPRDTTEGDVVAVLLGGATPFVLRPIEDAWSLIGECFLDGLMFGEALFGPLPRSVEPVLAEQNSGLIPAYKDIVTGAIIEDPRVSALLKKLPVDEKNDAKSQKLTADMLRKWGFKLQTIELI